MDPFCSLTFCIIYIFFFLKDFSVQNKPGVVSQGHITQRMKDDSVWHGVNRSCCHPPNRQAFFPQTGFQDTNCTISHSNSVSLIHRYILPPFFTCSSTHFKMGNTSNKGTIVFVPLKYVAFMCF